MKRSGLITLGILVAGLAFHTYKWGSHNLKVSYELGKTRGELMINDMVLDENKDAIESIRDKAAMTADDSVSLEMHKKFIEKLLQNRKSLEDYVDTLEGRYKPFIPYKK